MMVVLSRTCRTVIISAAAATEAVSAGRKYLLMPHHAVAFRTGSEPADIASGAVRCGGCATVLADGVEDDLIICCPNCHRYSDVGLSPVA